MFVLIWASLFLSVRGNNTEDAVLPRILNSSSCEAQMEFVTCVCVSEGFPLPTVTWLLPGNVDVHSVAAAASVSPSHTVNSTVVLTVTDHRAAALKCASRNDKGEAERNLTIPTNESKQEDLLKKLLITVQQPQVIIAFAIGILLSATVCCLTRTCHRKNPRRSLNVSENMDMMTMVTVPLVDVGEAVGHDDRTRYQEAAEGGAEAAGTTAPDGDQAPKEVEYSNIVFSVPGKSLAESMDGQEATETEYAEIKNEVAEERRDDGEELEEEEEEDDAMEEGEERETGLRMGEDVVLYSHVSK